MIRKALGWICYAAGGAAAVWVLQLIISCEILSIINDVENVRYQFWDFIFVSSGHHNAYPSGYLIHVMRDLLVLGWAALIITLGHDQFTAKESTRTERVVMLTCPRCRKKTYADAYCRFCGFNLITHQPSPVEPPALSVAKLSVLVYSGVSAVLLLLNLLMLTTR